MEILAYRNKLTAVYSGWERVKPLVLAEIRGCMGTPGFGVVSSQPVARMQNYGVVGISKGAGFAPKI